MTELSKKYRELVTEILVKGQTQDCRNGSQRIIPHHSFTLDFSRHDNHLLKLRKMYVKGIEGEFQTLIDPTPLVNISQFEANGCNYWKLWADKHGNLSVDYHNKMHPRLKNLISDIKIDPTSRRHILNLWDQDNVDNCTLSLPCCWYDMTFSVIGGVLHMRWTQRSVDTMVGLPSDIYLAYRFMNYIAEATDLAIGSCMFSLSNVHIYDEHIDKAMELLNRTENDSEVPLSFELKS